LKIEHCTLKIFFEMLFALCPLPFDSAQGSALCSMPKTTDMPRSFTLLVFLLVLLSACGPNYLLDETKDIPNGQWTYADSLRFEADIPDTSRIYDLYVSIEHSPDFEWQNLYLRIHTLFPDGQRLSRPVSFELGDQGGAWQGRCNATRCRFRVPMQEGAYFQTPGRYAFTFEQYMRQSPVGGIQRLGFHIVDTGKKR
jgi:gliding motility-associated lipoprotein GldH